MLELCVGQLAQTIGGDLKLGTMPPLGGTHEPVGPITTDTNGITEASLFWACTSSNLGRGAAAEEAFSRGALGVVTDRHIEPWAGRFAIQVDNPNRALQDLALWARRRFTGQLIAVTGSLGAPMTTSMIGAITNIGGGRVGEHDQLPAEIGLSLQLLNVDSQEKLGVVEINAADAKQMDSLSHLCCPHVGVITAAHHPTFTDDESLRQSSLAHTALVGALPDDGYLVADGDSPWLRRVLRDSTLDIIWFGRDLACDICPQQVNYSAGQLDVTVDGTRLHAPVWGRHHLRSVLAAYAVGKLLGISSPTIADGIANIEGQYEPTSVTSNGNITMLASCGSTCRQSLSAAIDLLRETRTDNRRIVVWADAEKSNSLGEHIAHLAVTRGSADRLIAFGPQQGDITVAATAYGMPSANSHGFASRQTLLDFLTDNVQPGDTLLVVTRENDLLKQISATLAVNESPARPILFDAPPAVTADNIVV